MPKIKNNSLDIIITVKIQVIQRLIILWLYGCKFQKIIIIIKLKRGKMWKIFVFKIANCARYFDTKN